MKNNELTNSRFGKWGWSMIIYTMLLYYFMAAIAADAMNLYPTFFSMQIGCDPNLLLGFATPAGLISVLGGIVFGRVVLKTGVRKMAGWSLIVTGVVYAIFGFVKTPVMYLIVLTVFSFLANAFGLIATATLMGNWFPRKKGIALGWATMGAPLCTATFVAILSKMYVGLGVGKSSVIVGVVILVLGIVTFFWVKDYPADVGASPDNISTGCEDLAAQQAAMRAYKSPFTVGRLLKDKDMWCIGLGFGMLWMVTVGIVSQFVPRMISVGFDNGEALLMLTIASVIGLVGSYFWGWLDQKVGTKLASCVYAFSYILALLLMIFAQVRVFNYIALVFVGFGIGGLLNLMPSMVIAVYGPYDFPAANGLVSPIAAVLQKGAFVIMAVALEASHGSYNLPYAIFIGIDVVGLILLLCVTGKCKGKVD